MERSCKVSLVGRFARRRFCNLLLILKMPATTNTYLKSLVVFTSSCLKVCLSTMVRHMPGLAPQVVASAPSLLARPRLHVRPQTVEKLIATILVLLSSLPDLCSPAGEEVAPWHQSSNLLFWGRFVWSSN